MFSTPTRQSTNRTGFMARKYLTIILFSLLLFPASLPAQTPAPQLKNWMEEIRKYKFDFFTKELGLNKEQQATFFPLYEEMERAIYKVNKESDELMKKTAEAENASDLEYEAAALALAKTKQEEGKIELDFFSKFEKILTKKQLFQLKLAEDRFTRNILNHHRQRTKQ